MFGDGAEKKGELKSEEGIWNYSERSLTDSIDKGTRSIMLTTDF